MKLLSILLLLFPFCISGQTPGKNNWNTVNQSGYSIQHPFSWEVDTTEDAETDLVLLSPLESSEDFFRENINIIIQDLSGYKFDLDSYTELSVDQIKSEIPKAKVIESKTISNAAGAHHKIIYTGEMEGFQLQFEQYYFVSNNKAYILTFTAKQKTFKKFKKTAEAIFDTFIISK